MQQEWHITVNDYEPVRWHQWCTDQGIKPLFIELNNFERQLMCAISLKQYNALTQWDGGLNAKYGLVEAIELAGFSVLRVKYEVQPRAIDVTTHGDKEKVWHRPPVDNALYYECHIKLEGQFRPEFRMASRDLYRRHRWYVTHRQDGPFTPEKFVEIVERRIASRNPIIEFEYEACLVDTNKGLDARWN